MQDTKIYALNFLSLAMDINAATINEWHLKRGWSGIGYHFFIKRDGQIELGRPLERSGAHTKGNNRNSIGICYAGGVDLKNNPEDNRTDKQKESFIILLKLLKRIFPNAVIHGHRDFSSKACPSFDATKEYQSL